MSTTRGRRRGGAAVPVLDSVKEVPQDQIVRKTLSTLQSDADNPVALTRTTRGGTSRKTGKQKVVSVSKENYSPMKTRSNRKATSSNSNVIPVKSSTTNSDSIKSAEDDPSDPKALTKYSEKLVSKIKNVKPIEFQVEEKETLESPEFRLSGISIQSESSGYGSDVFDKNEANPQTDTKAENNSETATVVDICLSPSEDVTPVESGESMSDLTREALDLMARTEVVTEDYWEYMAEKRRLALEETLHENELLRDQLEVIEVENSRLKKVVKEAERLAEAVQKALV